MENNPPTYEEICIINEEQSKEQKRIRMCQDLKICPRCGGKFIGSVEKGTWGKFLFFNMNYTCTRYSCNKCTYFYELGWD